MARRRVYPLTWFYRRVRWSDRLHDRRHRWEIKAEWRAWRWHQCRACGVWARSYTDEGRRRMIKRLVSVTRRAFVPGLVRSFFQPSPLLAALRAP